jgi:hypothetical protein
VGSNPTLSARSSVALPRPASERARSPVTGIGGSGRQRSARGEVLEWSIRHVWRTCERKLRGFESHPLRPAGRSQLPRGDLTSGMPRPPLDNFTPMRYYVLGRARWGASGALYPQPATAGSNHLSRPNFLGLPSLSGVEDRVRRGRNVPNPARFGRKQRSALLSWVLSGCLVGAG